MNLIGLYRREQKRKKIKTVADGPKKGVNHCCKVYGKCYTLCNSILYFISKLNAV